MQIHFIEKEKDFKRLAADANRWESGNWAVTPEVAEEAVGGDIFFHKQRTSPSYFGGKVLSFRQTESDAGEVRVVFEFEMTQGHRGQKTDRKGWTSETKIIRESA
ncbi:hypothetical protein Q4485_13590 [Granulosicoccaceae sp. 1_MG-2023]|nr:hypothetical protein [Granulosicoccaceae sp. 1_MG-2023]